MDRTSSDFIPAELIRRKRFGQAHSREEIRYLIRTYTSGQLPDAQLSAWLMAVCFRGLNSEETFWLTEEMRDSGRRMDLSRFGKTVDKHSTGGIGDKTSLILAPLVAAAGVKVPMMAGRGLGHTGGTLDKLESISGFNVQLSPARFEELLERVGTAIIGQTADICPADRKLYSLRDVTGTVDSLPLICGSIMSKKLAEGASALVLDVKFGSGAFMKPLAEAEALARALKDIGERAGQRVVALLTRMSEPLGRFVGNAVEVEECLAILENREFVGDGKGYGDTLDLSLELAAHMIYLGGRAGSVKEGRAVAESVLKSGQAREKFSQMCAEQGAAKIRFAPRASAEITVKANATGFLNYRNLEKIGYAGIQIGAGRRLQTDALDYGAGIEVFREHGAPISNGQPLFKIFAATLPRAESAVALLKESFTIDASSPARDPLIAKVIL